MVIWDFYFNFLNISSYPWNGSGVPLARVKIKISFWSKKSPVSSCWQREISKMEWVKPSEVKIQQKGSSAQSKVMTSPALKVCRMLDNEGGSWEASQSHR